MSFRGRPLAVSLVLAIAAAGVAANCHTTLANSRSGGATDIGGHQVIWRMAEGAVVEIVVNDAVTVTGLALAGGLSPSDRASIVAFRLTRLLSSDSNAGRRPGEDIGVSLLNGQWAVVAGVHDASVIVTADEKTAEAHRLPSRELACVWANNLRAAFGLELLDVGPMPSRGTQRTISAGPTNGTSDLEGVVVDKTLPSWQGVASWYGPGFHGRRTANGEVYNQYALTAAHRTLPFGTLVRVSSSATGKSVIVRINDRGPWVAGRNVDLSFGAAAALGMVDRGIAEVKMEVLRFGA